PHVSGEITLGEPGTPQFIRLASFATDQHGAALPTFQLPDWADGPYTLRVTAQTPKSPETVARTVHLKRSAKVMLSTDKPVYQPGQTIHVRALSLRLPDLKPTAGLASVFTITDPKGNVIFRRSEPASRFGIASADCPLDREILEGPYQVHCKVGETASDLTVRVEKYVLPKIKVTIQTKQPWYLPGQKVEGTIEAKYFHGEPVVDGEWKLTAAAEGFAETISGRTDQNGEAKFSFQLPQTMIGVPRNQGGAEFTLSA